MNDTRKQIIELIEPYMMKDLVDGCIVEFMSWWFFRLKETPFYDKKTDQYYTVTPYAEIENYIRRPLWHYDITAVLKYIKQVHWVYFSITPNCMFIKIMVEDWINPIHSIWMFPNKPLHLYTEQEEKDLLNILVNLK